MNYDLGYIDLEEKTLQPLHNPFGPKAYYVFGTFCKRISPDRTNVYWRRRKDSNPQDPFESNGFQDR